MINKEQRKKQLIPIIIGVIPFAYLYAYGGDSILHLDGPRLIKVCNLIRCHCFNCSSYFA